MNTDEAVIELQGIVSRLFLSGVLTGDETMNELRELGVMA